MPSMLSTTISFGTIAAGESATSDAIDLNSIDQPGGNFSLQLVITGDGTAKAEALCSNDDTNYVEAESASDIMSGKTAGTPLAAFAIPLCSSFKVKVTETGGANPVTVTGYLRVL